MSKKRIKSFHNSVNKEFKRRIENIFPLIPDNKVRNFSSIITWEIVQANPDKPWSWISDNPNITWEIVQFNLDKDWCWDSLSSNPNITWDIVQANLDKDWNWGRLHKTLYTSIEIEV